MLCARLENGPFNGHVDVVERAPAFVTVIDCGCGRQHVGPVDPDGTTTRPVYSLVEVDEQNARYVWQDDLGLSALLEREPTKVPIHPAHPRCRSVVVSPRVPVVRPPRPDRS